MIVTIDFSAIKDIWSIYLWPDRTSPIEQNSAMCYLGEYDMFNMSTVPTFYAYIIDNKIAGVNSGHMCKDYAYRSRGLYVHNEYRKLGIGTKLLLATIEQGKVENAKYVWSYPRKSSWITYHNAGFYLASEWEQSETSEANAYCRIDI